MSTSRYKYYKTKLAFQYKSSSDFGDNITMDDLSKRLTNLSPEQQELLTQRLRKKAYAYRIP